MEEFFPKGNRVIVSRKLIQRQARLLWAWRESAGFEGDSGWRFLSEEDTTQSLKKENPQLISITQLLQIEPKVEGILSYPVGADFQLALKQGGNDFVYNDTYEKVSVVSCISALPINDPIFQNHFSTFVHKVQKSPSQWQNKLEQEEQVQQQQLTSQLQLSQEELSDLEEVAQLMRKFLRVLVSDQVQSITGEEVFLIMGLVCGFLNEVNKGKLEERKQKNDNLVEYLLANQFEVSLEAVKNDVENYRENRDKRASARQIIAYGQLFKQWLEKDNITSIQSEYTKLKTHYLNLQD